MLTESLKMKATTTLNKQDLAEIFERHSPGIYRYALRLLNDADLAEDCVSETFSRFLNSIRNGQQPDMIQAYLYRAAHNWVIDHYRKNPLAEAVLDELQQSDPENNPVQQAMKNIDRQRIHTALMMLPAEQRQVVVLRFMEDWSHNDVAEALGKTIEATRALQHRAVAALRQMLAE